MEVEKHPGKQAITFLFIINISMFIMNLFEAEKFGVSKIVLNFYGSQNWIYLVRSFSPLTIFYRFHSSVMLAEIWRNVYAEKIQAHEVGQPSIRRKKPTKRQDRVHAERLEKVQPHNGRSVEGQNGNSRHRNVVNINIRD